MEVSPFTRSVASAAYNFLRWSGAAIAPVLAGYLATAVSLRSPFWVGTVMVTLSFALLFFRRHHVTRGLHEHAALSHAG